MSHRPRPRSHVPAWASCEPCGKRLYPTRRHAQAAAKGIPGDHMTAYRCPHADGFHLGHLPRSVVRGATDKAAYVARVERRQRAAS